MSLQKGWLTEKAGLAGAGTTNYKDILIPGILWLLRAARHGQALRHGHGDVLEEIRVYVRGNVRSIAPTGAAVFHTVPVLLGVLASQIYGHA